MEADFSSYTRSDTLLPLAPQEVSKVAGGFGVFGAGLGAIGGAVDGYVNGGGWSGAARGALFGAAIGLTGGLAAATTGFVRLGWAARSVGLTAGAGGISSRMVTDQR
jgi:hypothetical protein